MTILLTAILLPGVGHLLLGYTQRAMMFLFFMAVFGWVGIRLLPDASFFARHSGAILIYGFCVLDAYKIARIRYEQWRFGRGQTAAADR
ncbi:MAG: hypothetical protein H0T56_12535 [Pseudaminobacter sp.]|nr:hypothetical protein [Pseudaminobacter sp.]